MQILSNKATIRVSNPENTVLDPVNQVDVVDTSDNNSLVIHASRAIQVIPEWVKNDPTFKAHVKAGTILILQTMAIEDNDTAETKLIKAEAQAKDAGVQVAPITTGWGAQPEGIGGGFSTGLPK